LEGGKKKLEVQTDRELNKRKRVDLGLLGVRKGGEGRKERKTKKGAVIRLTPRFSALKRRGGRGLDLATGSIPKTISRKSGLSCNEKSKNRVS